MASLTLSNHINTFSMFDTITTFSRYLALFTIAPVSTIIAVDLLVYAFRNGKQLVSHGHKHLVPSASSSAAS
jgi:hypothetical protein